MAWRKAVAGPAAGAVAELLAWERECAERAAGGDARWGERLVSACSWLDMLRGAGYDPEVAELLAVFAADERAWYGAAGSPGGVA